MMQSSESKYVDTVATPYELNSTGVVTHLNIIPQGVSLSERLGKKVNLTSLQMIGQVTHPLSNARLQVQYAIILDRMPTGTLPTASEIFSTTDAYGFANDDNSSRFKILRNQHYTLTSNDGYGSVRSVYDQLFFEGEPTVYKNGITGDISGVEYGALYLVTMGDVADLPGTMTVSTRVRYKEY